MSFINILFIPLFIIFYPINYFRRSKLTTAKFQNILICGFYLGIGDFILLSALFKNLKAIYPDSKISVLIKDTMNDEFLISNPNINDVIKIPIQGMKRLDVLKYAFVKLRKLHFDLVLQHSWVDGVTISLFSFFTGAKYRIGFSNNLCGFSNTVNLKYIVQYQWNIKSTILEHHLEVLNYLGLQKFDLSTEVFIPGSAITFANQFLNNNHLGKEQFVLGIHAGSDIASKGRRWPITYFIELMNALLADYSDLVILFFGGKDECFEINKVKSVYKSNRVIVVDDILIRSAALIRKCNLFIANDNMNLHLAKALKVPVFGIFGPTNPKLTNSDDLYYPISLGLKCQPCWKGPPVICKYEDYRCLTNLKPNIVVDKCERFISSHFEQQSNNTFSNASNC
jgi:ADP-heptose:LPS heptosyltransferase